MGAVAGRSPLMPNVHFALNDSDDCHAFGSVNYSETDTSSFALSANGTVIDAEFGSLTLSGQDNGNRAAGPHGKRPRLSRHHPARAKPTSPNAN